MSNACTFSKNINNHYFSSLKNIKMSISNNDCVTDTVIVWILFQNRTGFIKNTILLMKKTLNCSVQMQQRKAFKSLALQKDEFKF